jgi:5'-deoxynucleotidase YfbR-like HD superfamily hydrolase
VRRYHTWPVIRQQTVGEHSWNVARMYYEMFGELPEHVSVYIIYHDVPELKVGDPPYPIKKDNPLLKKEMDRLEDVALAEMGITLPHLKHYEKLRVKLCDAIDCWEYANEELAMGNTTMTVVVDRIKQFVQEQIPRLGETTKEMLFAYLDKNGLQRCETSCT